MNELLVDDVKQLPSRGVQKISKPQLQNFGRPVLITDAQWHGEGKPKTPRERKGVFHIWGYKRTGGKTEAPSMSTVAIVELEDGRITTKKPEEITFLDKNG